jgi:hypothetical protein
MSMTTSRTRGHRTCRTGCRARRGVERSHRSRSREPVTVQGGRVFFSGRIPQHMKTHRLVDWLAAAAMVLAVACWGTLLSLLGS